MPSPLTLGKIASMLNSKRMMIHTNSESTTPRRIVPGSKLYLLKSWEIGGETVETVLGFILGGSKITADGDCSHEIKKMLTPWKESYDQPRQHNKKQRHYFANKGPSSQGYGFSSGHVWM